MRVTATNSEHEQTGEGKPKVRRAPRRPIVPEPPYDRAPHYLPAGRSVGSRSISEEPEPRDAPVSALCVRHVDELSIFADNPRQPAAFRDDLQGELAAADPDEWRMYVEDGINNDTYWGMFEDLIKVACDHGATVFFVWSPSGRTYVRYDDLAEVRIPE